MEIPKDGLILDDGGVCRCFWGGEPDIYRDYHDKEWGHPVAEDFHLFEKICLEGFQSGLSWLTILKKREGFRRAFEGFDFWKVAKFDEGRKQCLVNDASIIRHLGKIEATINNAKRACEMVEKFGSLASFFWKYAPPEEARPERLSWELLKEAGHTVESRKLAKDLKGLGWKFVGPTTAYAFMQAMGLVNDHIEGCAFREPLEEKRREFLKTREGGL